MLNVCGPTGEELPRKAMCLLGVTWSFGFRACLFWGICDNEMF